MKKLNLINSVLLLTLSAAPAFAVTCPDNSNAPKCPTSGSTLLDETYPTQAFVFSNQAYNKTKESQNVTHLFVSKILKSYDYENVPHIILPMTNVADFNALKANLKNKLTQKNLSEEKIEKILSQITHAPLDSYTWQQDWFESFVDLKTGNPTIRQIESYYVRVPAGSGKIMSETSTGSCAITNDKTLTTALTTSWMKPAAELTKSGESFGSGEMGGNIEGAPGGFCLAGDNQGTGFTKQFCGDEKNIIQLQTSWLSVGHVDEIFKIMPTHHNDGRPKECEFSLMAASPKKAMELMKASAKSKSPFFNIDTSDEELDVKEHKASRSNIAYPGNNKMCNYIYNAVKQKPDQLINSPKTRSVFLKLFFNFSTSADAAPLIAATSTTELINTCSENLDNVSNFEILEIMKEDENIMKLNQAVDESIAADKALIKQKILSRLPQCEKYYDELDVPNLFYGSLPYKDAEGKLQLPKPGTTDSFLPNPTNSVLMNKTVTFPDSGNTLFNSYLTEELGKRKMKSDFIPSWDYAHLGHGNTHCSSHSLPYCKP